LKSQTIVAFVPRKERKNVAIKIETAFPLHHLFLEAK
jgi:hypothetical protein